MGVNDFNTVTYTELTPLLNKLGVKYHLLSDTTSYYTLDNTFSYTIDGKWGTAMPKALRDEYDRFQEEAPDDSRTRTFAITPSSSISKKRTIPKISRAIICIRASTACTFRTRRRRL
jgi:hypothetical protein